ncbi:hypothetical protein D3C75_1031750 [compost metagenome]
MAARFMKMAAPAEFAVVGIGGKLTETGGQLLYAQLQKIQLAETRGVCHKAAAPDIHQLDMAGGMPSPA